jgi:hypothetical protein
MPVSLGLCGLDQPVGVFWRSGKGVKPKPALAGIDQIVPRACGNDDGIARLDLGPFAVQPDFAVALLDTEELVMRRKSRLPSVNASIGPT